MKCAIQDLKFGVDKRFDLSMSWQAKISTLTVNLNLLLVEGKKLLDSVMEGMETKETTGLLTVQIKNEILHWWELINFIYDTETQELISIQMQNNTSINKTAVTDVQ